MSEFQEGDTVTITATGKISQKTASGYIVTIHGVDVPFVQINSAPTQLAQKILEMIEKTEQELANTLQGALEDIAFLNKSIDDIKQLCQEEVNRQ